MEAIAEVWLGGWGWAGLGLGLGLGLRLGLAADGSDDERLDHEHGRNPVAVREEEVVGPPHHVEVTACRTDRAAVRNHCVHAPLG